MIKPNNKYHPSEEKFDHRTTIQDDYQFKGPVATKSYKPLNLVQKNMTPFENLTNYMLSYVPHPLEKRFVHEYEKYKHSDTPFDGLTTHKQSFRGLAGLPAKLMKPHHTVPCHDVSFPSSTEFRDKYLLWPHPPISVKKPAVYVPPVEKMDLKTTTQTHYTPHKGQPAKSCQPLAQFKKGTMPFDGCSTMKDDYKAWQCTKTKPIIHAPELKVAEEPMDYLTTFQTHYVPHPPTFTKSFKPGWSSLRSVTPFEGQTIYTSSYTPKKIARCLASYKEPPSYVFQEIDPAGHKFYLPVLETEHPLHSKGKEQESNLSGNGLSLQELAVTGWFFLELSLKLTMPFIPWEILKISFSPRDLLFQEQRNKEESHHPGKVYFSCLLVVLGYVFFPAPSSLPPQKQPSLFLLKRCVSLGNRFLACKHIKCLTSLVMKVLQ